MGVTSGAETAYPSGVSEFTPAFQWGSCCSIFSCRSNGLQTLFFLFVFFFLLLLYFLSFFDLRLLIKPLLSSNFFRIEYTSERCIEYNSEQVKLKSHKNGYDV
jgi:hypothetical protein